MTDQIHSPNFHELSDFIWSANEGDVYVKDVAERNRLTIFNPGNQISKRGIIYVGMAQLIEHCYANIPKDGSYIVIHRDNDRSYMPWMHQLKPESVKHVYTMNCAVKSDDVTAIPIGINTINGENNTIKLINGVERAHTKLFCRFNTNPETKERSSAIESLRGKDFAKVVTEQMDTIAFYEQIKAHRFTLSLQGLGKDCLRTWEAIELGSVPIVTDCIENRFFEDMPIMYYPNEIDESWIQTTEALITSAWIVTVSLTRTKMNYWAEEIKNRAKEL